MTKEMQKFIENNIDLIDSEDWKALLDNLLHAVPNTQVTLFLEILEEAGIETSDFAELRDQSFIESIAAKFRSLAPGRYTTSDFIYKLGPWHGYVLPEAIDFIYFNSNLWPSNIDVKDHDYKNGGYYIIEVK